MTMRLNKTVKKFGTSNFIISLGKIPFSNLKTTIKSMDKNEKI